METALVILKSNSNNTNNMKASYGENDLAHFLKCDYFVSEEKSQLVFH